MGFVSKYHIPVGTDEISSNLDIVSFRLLMLMLTPVCRQAGDNPFTSKIHQQEMVNAHEAWMMHAMKHCWQALVTWAEESAWETRLPSGLRNLSFTGKYPKSLMHMNHQKRNCSPYDRK